MLVSVAMQVGGGLGALLQMLGLAQKGAEGAEGKPGAEGQAEAKGLVAQGKEGLPKGAQLGPDGEVLAGLGYNGADKETGEKNVNEKQNVERFLKDTTVERSKDENPFSKLGERATEEAAPKEQLAEQAEAAETKEAADGEIRREEANEEARVVGQQTEAKEAKEQSEVEDAREQQHQQDDDEEEKPGAGWVAEELEDEEQERRKGLRMDDPLGEVHRCRHTLEDGTGCLRKPVSGTPYCREHAVLIVPRPIEKA